VAEAAGFPGAARLTVRALQGGNGLPWHRVVGAGGRIALPGASGQEQRLRLEIEGVTFRGNRVRMDLHGWSPRVRGARRRLPADPRPGRTRRKVKNGDGFVPAESDRVRRSVGTEGTEGGE
jgi:methylated-DNA-protein-cysteine methyltransferase related protein